jgi:Leucine Rich repeat
MGFYENLETWQGLPVVDWTAPCGTLQPSSAYRLRIDWDDKTTWVDRFAEFLEQPGVSTITALVVGNWGTDDHGNLSIIVELITGARERLPALTALFLGDITSEECEVSWIPLADVSPLFHAYPKLEHFAVRGGMNDNQDLTLGVLKHAHLKSLSVQTGGLNASIVEEVSIAELPELEFLELYLGTESYGGTVTPADLHTILTQGHEKWPKLRTLGLCDYDRADALAIALTAEGGVPVLAHLQTLNLSLGTLGDEGVEALAACPAIAKLAKLDIHHHYASPESVAKLMALGIEIDASDVQTEDGYGRYVAVSE